MDKWVVDDELSVDISEVKKVTVRIVAGDLTVTSGETAHIEVKRESGAPVTVEFSNGSLFVSQPEPDVAPIEKFIKLITENRRHRCSVTITVPAATPLDLHTVSAEALVSGFASNTKVQTVSGDVTMSDLTSEVDVKTVSGDVEAKNVAAGLKLKTVSGDVAVADGSCRWLDAKTVSGDVLLDLDLDPNGTYDVTTVSGDVSVRTISEPNLAVDASTISGHLVSDFGLGWDAKPGRKRVSETIGDGGARLWVKTVSGDLRVLRGRAAA